MIRRRFIHIVGCGAAVGIVPGVWAKQIIYELPSPTREWFEIEIAGKNMGDPYFAKRLILLAESVILRTMRRRPIGANVAVIIVLHIVLLSDIRQILKFIDVSGCYCNGKLDMPGINRISGFICEA